MLAQSFIGGWFRAFRVYSGIFRGRFLFFLGLGVPFSDSLRVGVIFPECVAKGSRFTLGVWGWRRVRSTPLLRPQPSATVDNMAVPMASSAKVVTFGGFKRRVALFHVAGVVLCDIPTFFITCRKSFCVACAILLRRFQKMSCIFSWRSTLETSIVILRGRRNTSGRVVWRVLGESHCQGCAKWIQGIPWQAWHYFVRRDANWWKPRTKHRFWGSKFWGSWENL